MAPGKSWSLCDPGCGKTSHKKHPAKKPGTYANHLYKQIKGIFRNVISCAAVKKQRRFFTTKQRSILSLLLKISVALRMGHKGLHPKPCTRQRYIQYLLQQIFLTA